MHQCIKHEDLHPGLLPVVSGFPSRRSLAMSISAFASGVIASPARFTVDSWSSMHELDPGSLGGSPEASRKATRQLRRARTQRVYPIVYRGLARDLLVEGQGAISSANGYSRWLVKGPNCLVPFCVSFEEAMKGCGLASFDVSAPEKSPRRRKQTPSSPKAGCSTAPLRPSGGDHTDLRSLVTTPPLPSAATTRA